MEGARHTEPEFTPSAGVGRALKGCPRWSGGATLRQGAWAEGGTKGRRQSFGGTWCWKPQAVIPRTNAPVGPAAAGVSWVWPQGAFRKWGQAVGARPARVGAHSRRGSAGGCTVGHFPLLA